MTVSLENEKKEKKKKDYIGAVNTSPIKILSTIPRTQRIIQVARTMLKVQNFS